MICLAHHVFQWINLRDHIGSMIKHIISQFLGKKDKYEANLLNVDILKLIIDQCTTKIIYSLLLGLIIFLC